MTKPAEHKSYEGRAISAKHLGLIGKAWVTHAWDDWYYCHVEGKWPNGNPANGVLCRERANVVAQYLIESAS